MFNVGSEDKEKLRENMEEIKNLIQGHGDSSNKQPSTANNPAAVNNNNDRISKGNLDREGGSIEESSFDSGSPLNQSSDNPVNSNSPSQTEQIGQEPVNSSQDNQSFNPGNTSETSIENNVDQANNTPDFSQQDNSQNSSSVEPKTVQQNSAPQGKETSFDSRSRRDESQKLFLEVERFEKVKDMIEEMQQLTQDIETTSTDLEEQIEDEKESENVAQQLLDNFEDRKQEVESVVLESDEN
jgi:hypothetical protein